MSSSRPDQNPDPEEMDDDLLDADEAAEEIQDDDEDMPMDSDEEINLHNDSIAYFDIPQDSLFSIAQHPVYSSLIAVGGAAGPEDDAPGAGWLFDTSAAKERPVLPASYASDPASAAEENATSTALESIFSLEGHSDSIGALCWTLPQGQVLVSGGMDGKLQAWKTDVKPGSGVKVTLLGEAQEVEELTWISPCPSTAHPNTIALGASDGSVWVYSIDPSDSSNPLQILQSYFLHTGPCTAGAWTPDGQFLATVSEDNSFYVWDVFGAASAQNMVESNGQTTVSMNGEDQRFEVQGGFTSIAIDPKGAFAAAGAFDGQVKIVSLPRLSTAASTSAAAGAAANKKKKAGSSSAAGRAAVDPSAGGQILASLQTQSGSIETIAISQTSTTPPTTLLATGSVDGSICVFDATRRFDVRRHIVPAHGDHAVVKLEFVKNSWLLTSCGLDGEVKRWDLRGGVTSKPGSLTNQTGPAESGLVKEWKGHRGDGEGGGVLGFVQGETGERVVTAGDDGISLVFAA